MRILAAFRARKPSFQRLLSVLSVSVVHCQGDVSAVIIYSVALDTGF